MRKTSILKWKKVGYGLFLVILTACGQVSLATPTPTVTTKPTVSPTSTATPLPANTNTPEPTPTKVIKQFKQCDADNWKKCYIPLQDLGIEGTYYDWLNVSWNPDLPAPDPNKVAIHRHPSGSIIYSGVHGGKITKGDVPFSTGFSYGYTECGITWDGISHDMICAVVPIAISVPNKPGETKKLIGLVEQAYDETDTEMASGLKYLQNNNMLMLAGFTVDKETNQVNLGGHDTIDFLQETIRNYPDVYDRFGKFQETLDPSYLSGPGLIILVFGLY